MGRKLIFLTTIILLAIYLISTTQVINGIETDTSADPKNIKGYADAVNRYGEDLGSYGFFVDGGEGNLDQDIINQAKSVTNKDTIIVVSLHLISGGWESFTDDQVNKLISALSTVNQGGQRVMLRFMHEMNGGWYQYGQQPEKYVSYFKKVADLVHQKAPLTGMMWSPNHVDPSSADTVFDQYWPGDQYVDCVGLSLYYRGDESNAVSPVKNILYNIKAGGFLDLYVTKKKKPFWMVSLGFASYYKRTLSDDRTIKLLSTFITEFQLAIQQLNKEGDIFKGWTYLDLETLNEKRKFSITNILFKPMGKFEAARSYLKMAKEFLIGESITKSNSKDVNIHNRNHKKHRLRRNKRLRKLLRRYNKKRGIGYSKKQKRRHRKKHSRKSSKKHNFRHNKKHHHKY